jgi:2-polyprenyl-3-methyl-5-hydroxy-6-metoxy-1,4-benzoquinol methylase
MLRSLAATALIFDRSMSPDTNYAAKEEQYFTAARRPFVDDLPGNPSAKLLEIGCGAGETAAYAMATGKCGWCCGVELCEGPARQAQTKMNQVVVGNVESMALDLPNEHFDILLLSEVLEHLVDPWAVLKRLRPLLKPGALIRAGSPNVCHYSVVVTLLKGRWRYEHKGIFDATHLRWFSPDGYREMFEGCELIVDEVRPARPLNPKARLINLLTGRRFEYMFHSQIFLKAHRPK